MAQGQQRCFGCGGVLEPGFLEDAGEHSRGYVRWIPGPIEKGLFGGARRWGKPRGDVNSYRCTLCGMLSLYVGGSPELTLRGRAILDGREPGSAADPAGNRSSRSSHRNPHAPAPSPFTDEA